MTEPSKEAVEALARTLWLNYQAEMEFTDTHWDRETEEHRNTFRDQARGLLRHPVSLERERWEKEARERLEKLPRYECEEEEGSDYYRTRSAVMEEDCLHGDWLRQSDVLAIFEKGEAE